MEHILDETVPNEDLKKFEQKYHEELNNGKVIYIWIVENREMIRDYYFPLL